ncbi:MAG: hypothetical protein IPM37_14675 [Hahellaceae bacterium]|nr:hypothetical protein [Hahellaceae bacterium]
MKAVKPVSLALGALGLGVMVFSYFMRDSDPATQGMPFPEITSDARQEGLPNAMTSADPTSGLNSVKTGPSPALTQPENDGREIPPLEYSLETRIELMQARRPDQSFDPVAVDQAVQQPAAWSVDPAVAESLGLDDEERYDGREFIRFSPLKLESMMPGDEMEIPLDQENATFNMVVDSVEVFPDGNVAWRGHLKDFPAENQISFTRGIDLTVGNITLPDKQFTVQAQGEKGWVVNSFTLFKGGDEHMFPVDDNGEDSSPQRTTN